MKDFSTLGEMLIRRYVTEFMDELLHLSTPIYSQLGVLNNMSWNPVEENTDFGTLLHKEGLWSLYKYKEEKSLLYHLCRNEYYRYQLTNNPVDPDSLQCSFCQEEAPNEISGLWKLHNFEWVQANSQDITEVF